MGDPLREYRARRDFERTPEPRGHVDEGSRNLRFVVHRHDARNLHYDLRLEMGGVLQSWAVPRGFSYDPSVKRLAMRTEAHPMEYETFSGVIPKGAYGAGTMTVWDSGAYELLLPRDPAEVDLGKVEVVLRGRRLRGEWHLFRPNGARLDEWLLIKSRDLYARSGDENALGGDLTRATATPWPHAVAAMEPGGEVAPFSDPNWSFELEFAGTRVFVLQHEGRVTVRKTSDAAEIEVPGPLVDALQRIRGETSVIDGMLVALDAMGRPDPRVLERALRGDASAPITFYACDLLQHDDWDLRPAPIEERKARLGTILPTSPFVQFVSPVPGRGRELFVTVDETGLPGVIGKRLGSPYEDGPSSAWVRIPTASRPEQAPSYLISSLAALDRHSPTLRGGIQLTNRHKIYWPENGVTKGDILAYYDQVAPFLLPYLRDRPIHLLRFPDGVDGKSFYQHKAPDGTPEWVESIEIWSESHGENVRHLILQDRDALLFAINSGSIDLHPWMSRRKDLDHPDWMVIDLDPKEAPFTTVVKVARVTGKLLHRLDLPFWMKTSGASGLHMFLRLAPGTTYDQSRMLGEALARVVVKEHRDLATVERATGKRHGRVYIDVLQNRRGQTVVPPWVVRPVPGATVSTPISWDELDGDLSPKRFPMPVALERLSQSGDVFAAMLQHPGIDLLAAIERLSEYLGG